MIFKYCLFILLIGISISNASVTQIKPLKINFKGIEAAGDTIIAYGDCGSALLSFDDARTWKQVRVFEQGDIIKAYNKNGIIAVIGEAGQIKTSVVGGNNWDLKLQIQRKILSVIEFESGYFLRCDSSLIILSTDFIKEYEYQLYSPPTNPLYNFDYTNSTAYFKQKFVVDIDSSKFLIFDKSLKQVDTVSLRDKGLCSTCLSKFILAADSENLFLNTENKAYKTSDFINFELLPDFTVDYNTLFKVISGTFYILTFKNNFNGVLSKLNKSDSVEIILNFANPFHIYTMNNRITDFTISNGKLLIAGTNKTLAYFSLTDSVLDFVSNTSGFFNDAIPEILNDSTFLLYSSIAYGKYDSYLFLSTDNCNTITPRIKKNNTEYIYHSFYMKNFDRQIGRLFLIGTNDINKKQETFYTDDLGKNLTFFPYQNFGLSNLLIFRDNVNYTHYQSLIENGDNFLESYNSFYKNVQLNTIATFSNNFTNTSLYHDSNFVIINVLNSNDTNTYLVHSFDNLNNVFDIRQTINHGKTWERIIVFDQNDSLLFTKRFTFIDKPYYAIFNFNTGDSLCHVFLIDIENSYAMNLVNFNCILLYLQNMPYDNYLRWVDKSYSIDADKDTLYIAIKDTLFYTTNIFDKSEWKYHLLPNNGRIYKTLKKFGDRFYACYTDDNNPKSIYWLTLQEDTVKPKPLIAAGDTDFGEADIRSSEGITKEITISNPSPDAALKITGYEKPANPAFSAILPYIDSADCLEIEPLGVYSFQVIFMPDSEKVYVDSIVFHSNAEGTDNVSYLYGVGIDTALGVSETKIESLPYLYFYPPYPIPASTLVKALIYWDPKIDIDEDEITVSNIYGTKVAGRDKIRIDKEAAYKGYLVWECAGFPDGVYFIQLKHGANSMTLKIMLAR